MQGFVLGVIRGGLEKSMCCVGIVLVIGRRDMKISKLITFEGEEHWVKQVIETCYPNGNQKIGGAIVTISEVGNVEIEHPSSKNMIMDSDVLFKRGI
jgi:hypothetical protein